MSLLDGLKDSMKNPLAENNEDMEFALESDFDLALERATDVRLSPEDIRAILNGDDDIPDDGDDLDDPDDDIDKDYTSELEACKEALEATMTELGIDTAGDELSEDDTDDLELDPEGDDEIISEEQLIAQIESISNNNDEQVDLMAQLESLLPDEDDEPPADDSAMESPDYLIGKDKNIHVHSISESDDEDDDDEDEEHEEHESKHHEHEEHESEEEEEEEHDHKHDEDDEDEDDEDEDEGSLESILDNLLSI